MIWRRAIRCASRSSGTGRGGRSRVDSELVRGSPMLKSGTTQRMVWIGAGVVASLLCGFGLRASFTGLWAGMADADSARATRIERELEDLPDPGEIYRRVVELILPTFVTVDAIGQVETSLGNLVAVPKSGAGVVVDPDGRILTVYHVVSDAAEGGTIRVTLHDGRAFP